MSSNYKVKQVAFGVSFNNKFKLLDSWGDIVDDILYKNKYFSSEFFPRISTQNTAELKLYNLEKQHFFVLTASNIVFSQTIENTFDHEFEDFKKRVLDYIIPNILTPNTLVVRRLGIVYTCELSDDQIKTFASRYFNPSINGIMDFRFSKKEATKKGAAIADNTDFINKIFTVGNISEATKGISYDYQVHFSPLRQDVRDIGSSFISDSFTAFKTDVN